eukprot:3705635-Amphidinium_carterae.1
MGDRLPTVDFGTNLASQELVAGSTYTCVMVETSLEIKCWGYFLQEMIGAEPGEMGDALNSVLLTGEIATSTSTSTSSSTTSSTEGCDEYYYYCTYNAYWYYKWLDLDCLEVTQTSTHQGARHLKLCPHPRPKRPETRTPQSLRAAAFKALDNRNYEGNFSDGDCSATEVEAQPIWAVNLGEEYAVKLVDIYLPNDTTSELLIGAKVRGSDARTHMRIHTHRGTRSRSNEIHTIRETCERQQGSRHVGHRPYSQNQKLYQRHRPKTPPEENIKELK